MIVNRHYLQTMHDPWLPDKYILSIDHLDKFEKLVIISPELVKASEESTNAIYKMMEIE